MITRNRIKTVLTIAVVALALTAVTANAAIIGELGILDDTANDGINPATDAAWAIGDQYRLAFVSEATRDATSADIEDYNAFLQATADAVGLGGATWKCIGQSYNDPDRTVNTGVTAPGEGIFLVDGVTKLWDDYADLWSVPESKFNMTETGGTYEGNVATGSSRKFGDPTQTKIEHGNSGRLDGAWWQVYNGQQASQWHFYALSDPLTVGGADPNLPFVDAGADMISWSGAVVALDANVVNNDTNEPQGTLTYLWTAEPNGIGDPNLDVAITGADTEDASVTITKTAPTGDATVVTMTLAVTLEGKDPVTDTMTIDVYDDSCLAAKAIGPVEIDATDLDENCITNFEDFAVMATTWLDDYTLTGPVAK